DRGQVRRSFLPIPTQRSVGDGVLVELRRDRDAAFDGGEYGEGIGDERAQGVVVGEWVAGAQRQFPRGAAAFAPLPIAALPLLARGLKATLDGLRAVVLPAAARRECQRFA